MSESEDLIKSVLLRKCETPNLEVKAALNGTPKVYDTLSSFSNQIDGGDIVFGIDEKSGFSVTGVYDAQKLQKDLVKQCKEMQPERVLRSVRRPGHPHERRGALRDRGFQERL